LFVNSFCPDKIALRISENDAKVCEKTRRSTRNETQAEKLMDNLDATAYLGKEKMLAGRNLKKSIRGTKPANYKNAFRTR